MLNLAPRLSSDGVITPTPRGWIFSIPKGTRNRYRLAQLDDQKGLARHYYPWRAPLTLRLEARVSSPALPGTWGFGFWNDPYGFSFGPGNGFLRLPALPNAAWYFFSSETSYLSFRDNKPANGFLAQVFASKNLHPSLLLAAAALPFSRRTTRRLLGRIIGEDAVALVSLSSTTPKSAPRFDITKWHSYELDWTREHTAYRVDGKLVLDSALSPHGPLGLVIWIDNQHAGFRPNGRISWGMEENPEPAWMEIQSLSVNSTRN